MILRFPSLLPHALGLWMQVKPHVDHAWVRVGEGDSAVDNALLAAIESDPDYQAGKARVLVFTGNTGNADRVRFAAGHANGVVRLSRITSLTRAMDLLGMHPMSDNIMLTPKAYAPGCGCTHHTHLHGALPRQACVWSAIELLLCHFPLQVSAFLHDQGIPNHLYHKNITNQDQAAALSAMAHPTPGDNLVMVSTDAAARGIDLPEVSHVIQADFVANAIEFLHRVGRTARAGRRGKVTSLYGASDVVLAEALRKYVEAGEPVEDCFSRNRSFSRKVKRYGKFVPRGQEGPQ